MLSSCVGGITRIGRAPMWITFVVTDPVSRLPTAPAPCVPIAMIAQSSISAARAIAVAASPSRTVAAVRAATSRRTVSAIASARSPSSRARRSARSRSDGTTASRRMVGSAWTFRISTSVGFAQRRIAASPRAARNEASEPSTANRILCMDTPSVVRRIAGIEAAGRNSRPPCISVYASPAAGLTRVRGRRIRRRAAYRTITCARSNCGEPPIL